MPGSSLDLTNGFDFEKISDRRRAWQIIEKDNPLLVIGSPPCTYFSVLNELNKHLHRDNAAWMHKYEEHLRKAKQHVQFCTEVYQHQIRKNRYFLHEHPWQAKSWKMPCIEKLEAMNGVERVRMDMCEFGMDSHIGPRGGPRGPVLKPTGMLTNSHC